MNDKKLYPIKRWDVIQINTVTKQPIIYIKPDKDFFKLIKNNLIIDIEIKSTDKIYDGKIIKGIVNSSQNVPNQRPNYFKKTGYYTIRLKSYWYGYPHPSKLGNVSFPALNQSKIVKEQEELLPPLQVKEDSNNVQKKNYKIITLFLVFILFIIIGIYMLLNK